MRNRKIKPFSKAKRRADLFCKIIDSTRRLISAATGFVNALTRMVNTVAFLCFWGCVTHYSPELPDGAPFPKVMTMMLKASSTA